jgi:hypothetical protein
VTWNGTRLRTSHSTGHSTTVSNDMGTTLGVEVGAPLESRLGAELGTLLDPSANFNTIISSKFNSNGSEGIPDMRLPTWG